MPIKSEKEIDWKKAARHYFEIALWFAGNEPPTPVPDWCFLAWPPHENNEREIDNAT